MVDSVHGASFPGFPCFSFFGLCLVGSGRTGISGNTYNMNDVWWTRGGHGVGGGGAQLQICVVFFFWWRKLCKFHISFTICENFSVQKFVRISPKIQLVFEVSYEVKF